MIDYDDDNQPERSEQEIREMIRPEPTPLEPVPDWMGQTPEPTDEEVARQMAIEAEREAAELEYYRFNDDNPDDHAYEVAVKDNEVTLVKRSEMTEEERAEAYLAKQREKDRKAIADLLADEPDPLLEELNKGNEIKPVNYVIQNLIPERSVGFLVGESGAKKTFAALHMALCVARGVHFGGLPVRQGSVMYFAPEDANGVRERYAGWKYTQNKNENLPNFWVLGQQVPLHREDLLRKFGARIKDSAFFQANPLSLIVIDTYSANSAGQKVGQTPVKKDGKIAEWVGGRDFDENDNNVAAILMKNAADLADMLECAVMIIHHTGKDTERGGRGASALKANAGFEVLVKKCAKDRELFIIEHSKAKGCALLPPRAMRTKSAKLPPDLVKMKRDALARMTGLDNEAKNNPAAWEIGDNLGTLVVVNKVEPVPTDKAEEKDAGEEKGRTKQEEHALQLLAYVVEYNHDRASKNYRTPKLTKAALREWAKNFADPSLDKHQFARAFKYATEKAMVIKMAGDQTLTASTEAPALLGGIREQQPRSTDWKPTSGGGDLDDF
ncbi:putative primase/helicase [Salmonella phage Lumpael]|uniref:Putative primase/helicase n=1 Tax=Salmonella phage Lumpael TaxID=2488859 RepID=A0A3G8F307_9CAUD|nr:putative primase/helicase [Salmonella phage Lumpael]AZF88761.1 putative primase/helicase [Salmonella phage Lumpael]